MFNKKLNFNFLFKRQDFLITIGLILWFSIYNVLETRGNIWINYFLSIAWLSFCLLPVLLFSFYKPELKAKLNKDKYLLYWLLCFLFLLPAFTLICSYFELGNFDEVIFIVVAIAAFLLEVILIANQFYRKKVQHIKWIKKIGLENSVLITLILLSASISVMAVSSLNNPAYHTKDNLLIGFELSPEKLGENFGLFIGFFVQFLLMYLCGYVLFIINSRFLVSKILKEKGLLIYILSLAVTIAVLYPLLAQFLILLPINKVFGREIFGSNPFDMENAMGAVAIMLISLPIVLALQWGKQNNQILSLEKEKSQSELDLLKQQLNPHFFFNTLNNLYALSLQKSEKTSESILQLSELMRYTIYKGQEKSVSLGQELKYLEDYIQLQQIRLKNPLNLKFEKNINNPKLEIAPLLLIVFIENAFKHGIETAENSAFLNISLVCNEKELYFSCENSFDEENTNIPGIGIANLKKRLDLLYPNKHSLKLSSENHIFKAELKLKLA
ncbi:MAG: sensor histidine kinase [Sphingobacteriaceae bacterium]|jgi:sensor histidine kinase YesM|nr:sensor histidine kinase [Sphingobacteriaceae bacterium]